MPVPNKKDNEKQEDFLSRCMSDPKMREEYDYKQRLAVCIQSGKADNVELNEEPANAAVFIDEDPRKSPQTYIRLNLLENGEIAVDYSADDIEGFSEMLKMIISGEIGQEVLHGVSDSIDDDASRQTFINMFAKKKDGPVIRPSEFKV